MELLQRSYMVPGLRSRTVCIDTEVSGAPAKKLYGPWLEVKNGLHLVG